MATKYFRSSLTVDLPDGTKKRLRFTGKTQKEADKKRDKAKAEYDAGLLVINSKTTFSKWCEEWLEVYKKPKVAVGTLNDIKGILNRTYLPHLKNLKLEEIRLVHLQKCLNSTCGTSHSNIRKNTMYIKDIFKKAQENDLIIRNPALGLIEPSPKDSEPRRPLTSTEKEVFLSVMETHHRGAFFGILLACGLRPQEARALTIFSVDKTGHNITITEAIENATQKIKTTKTQAGKRIIPVPNWFWGFLEKAVADAEKSNSCYLFQNSKGKPMDKQRYLDSWHSFLREMDIAAGAKLYRNKVIVHAIDQSLTPYYLRHTYATELAEKGVDLKTAQYLLGHRDIKVTANIYTHVTKFMIDDARDKINNGNSLGKSKESTTLKA